MFFVCENDIKLTRKKTSRIKKNPEILMSRPPLSLNNLDIYSKFARSGKKLEQCTCVHIFIIHKHVDE